MTEQRLTPPVVWAGLRRWFAPVPAELAPPAGSLRRRRWVVAATLIAGAGALAWGLRSEPGGGWFYVATGVLASIWLIGGLLAGPVHLGWEYDNGRRRGRPLVRPLVIGLLLSAVFVVGALVVRQIDPLAARIADVVDYARRGSGPLVLATTVINGVCEEVFFRGALQPAMPPRAAIAMTTVIYTAVAMASGNVMLGFAAILLGLVVAVQRRATAGVLAPAITHAVWGTAMFYALPALFR